jgi:surface carbohydrate biosynthesis protein
MIFLPVENWAREFYYKFDLASTLARQYGCDVALIPKNSFNFFMRYINGTVMHKSLLKNFVDEVENFTSRGNNYFYIDEEAVIRHSIPFDVRYGVPHEYVTGVFAQTDEEMISFKNNGFSNKVHFTGNPRHSRISQLQFNKDRSMDQILFSSNFSYIRPLKKYKLSNVFSYSNFSKSQEDKLRKFLEEHKKRELKIRSYLKELSLKEKVIYRVHPIEDLQKAIYDFKDSKVIVRKGGDIIEDLMRSKSILHCGCTVSFESSLMGHKPIFLNPFSSEKSEITARVSRHLNIETSQEDQGDLLGDIDKIKDIVFGKGSIRNDSLELIAKTLADSEKKIKSSNISLEKTKIIFFGLIWNLITLRDEFENGRYDFNYRRYIRKYKKNKLDIQINEFINRHIMISPSVNK